MPLTYDLPPALTTEQFEVSFTDWQHSQVVLQEAHLRLVHTVGDSEYSHEPELVWDDASELMLSVPLEEIAEASSEELASRLDDCMSIRLERFAQDSSILNALQKWGETAINAQRQQRELLESAKSSDADAFTLFALGCQINRHLIHTRGDLTKAAILTPTVALLDKIHTLNEFTKAQEGEFFTNVAEPYGVATGKLGSNGLTVTEKDRLLIPTDGHVFYFPYTNLQPSIGTSGLPNEDVHVWEDLAVNERDLRLVVIKDASELVDFTGWYKEVAWFAGLMPPEGCEIPDQYQEIRTKVFQLGQLAAAEA